MRLKVFMNNASSSDLSRRLTVERIKKSGLGANAGAVSKDPDVEAFRKAVRSSQNRDKKVGVSAKTLKRLAGI
jgi:hypothetical protein